MIAPQIGWFENTTLISEILECELARKKKHTNVGLRQLGIVLFGGVVFPGIDNVTIAATVVLCLTCPVIYRFGCEE